ncbi:hypothetical protein SAMN04515674_102310 [Pseudarcicella hirudinis]|uniref:Uncharacterized protein n=1 Tax=Pseudarcicella hirudinis TaxID=1079859 RepID=A0A1I5P852_9BACT|nr:hypothetical protein [Pseudarcicella hirudinis]SFP29646.1 hypothetical protein SAMN04515674_102310 [Pseudarcicella hirudinis]
MRKNLPFLLLLLISTQAIYALSSADSTERLNLHKINPNTSTAIDEVTAFLSQNDRSTVNQQGEKRFYDTFRIFLNKGEEVAIEHKSSDFRVMLSLVSPLKKTEFSYDQAVFAGNSKNTFYYIAPVTGIYTLFSTSADPAKSGRYSLKKTITRAEAQPGESSNPLADKLNRLIYHRKNKFSDVIKEKLKEEIETGEQRIYFQSSFELIDGKQGTVIVENGGSAFIYKSNLLEATTKSEAESFHKELSSKLRSYAQSKNWEIENTSAEIPSFYAASETESISLDLREVKGKFLVIFSCN